MRRPGAAATLRAFVGSSEDVRMVTRALICEGAPDDTGAGAAPFAPRDLNGEGARGGGGERDAAGPALRWEDVLDARSTRVALAPPGVADEETFAFGRGTGEKAERVGEGDRRPRTEERAVGAGMVGGERVRSTRAATWASYQGAVWSGLRLLDEPLAGCRCRSPWSTLTSSSTARGFPPLVWRAMQPPTATTTLQRDPFEIPSAGHVHKHTRHT
jgi:hypothetical protein